MISWWVKIFFHIFLRMSICMSVNLPLPLFVFIGFLTNPLPPPLSKHAFWLTPMLLFNGQICFSQTLIGILILLHSCWGSQFFWLLWEMVHWPSWTAFSLAIHPNYHYNLQILNLECFHSNPKQLNSLTYKMQILIGRVSEFVVT